MAALARGFIAILFLVASAWLFWQLSLPRVKITACDYAGVKCERK